MSYPESKDAQLFVYLTWETRDDCPVFHDDQLRQAAYLAIKARTRTQLCHVLALGGTPCQIHMIAQFPASLPVNALLRMSREAAQEAITRHQEMLNGSPKDTRSLWGREYTAHTLNALDVAQAQTYLRQQIEE